MQSDIVEFYSASLRLNPLVLFGLVPGGADQDITHVRDDGIGPNFPRADIVAHSRQAITIERLGLDGVALGWLDVARQWLAVGHALSTRARARLVASLKRAATSDPVRDTLARIRGAMADWPRPTIARLAGWLGVAGLVALPLLPDLGPPPDIEVARSVQSASSETSSPPSPLAVAPATEDRPRIGTSLQFSKGNLRYCFFQQVRLEAIGPVSYSAEQDVYGALVTDWNSRCARFRYARADKDAVDAEVKSRRVTLEGEGRTLVRGWQRQIETALQRAPAPAPASDVAAPVAGPPSEPLPSIIMMGRDLKSDIVSWGFNPLIRSPSLVLLRPDAATRVQERLNELGYAIKPADGTWGPTSRNALRRFKEANELLWNDGFDIETVARLFSASAKQAITPAAGPRSDVPGTFETAYPPPPGASLNPLNRTDAQRIQRRLAALGYYGGNGDGQWGVTSRRALRAFKTANDLADDDDWDAITESVLNEEQALRVSAANNDGLGPTGVTPVAIGASPVKPEALPMPVPRPAKRTALPLARDEAPRPPATIPARQPNAANPPAR